MSTDNKDKEELEACPKCGDSLALTKWKDEVSCGRCGFNAPFDSWQVRAAMPVPRSLTLPAATSVARAAARTLQAEGLLWSNEAAAELGGEPFSEEAQIDQVAAVILSCIPSARAAVAAPQPPMCAVHAALDRKDTLVLEVGNGCIACSLHERTALLSLLEPFAADDGSQDSLTVLRGLIASAASSAVAAPQGDDLIKRQDAISLARAHDKRHSSGYRCYEGEAIADKIAALPAYVPDIRSAAERVSRAIVEGGLSNNAPSANSWDEGKHNISLPPVSPSLPERESLVEALAALAHEQWSGWMRYIFQKAQILPRYYQDDREMYVPRWQRQMETSYEDLPENEKESDRKEARRMIEVFRAAATPVTATSGARECAEEVATWVMNLEHPLTSETDLYTAQGIIESIISKHFPSAVPPLFTQGNREAAIRLLRELRETTDPEEIQRQKDSWARLEAALHPAAATTDNDGWTDEEFAKLYPELSDEERARIMAESRADNAQKE